MKKLQILFVLILITGFWCFFPSHSIGRAAPLQEVSSQDLINLINGMRVGQGLPALEVNSILMATAQGTSDTMAVNDLHWHIGGVSERIQSAGYGGGAKVWATENFAIGPMTIDRIQQVWADESHMLPVVNPAYTHIGAGVTEYNGRVWYIVHAAYVSGGNYTAPTSETEPGEPAATSTPPVSQIMIPVQTATAVSGGTIIHEVKSGQSLWSIAIAYDTKIAELVRLNNLSGGDAPTIYTGQKLVIVAGEATATPDPNAAETPVEPTAAPTLAATKTRVPPTATPTKTSTNTAQPETTAVTTITPTTLPKTTAGTTQNLIFNNKTIGIILVGSLALGILLIITGSIQKPKR